MAKTSAEAYASFEVAKPGYACVSCLCCLLGRRLSGLGVGGDSRKDDVVAALSSLSFAFPFRDSFKGRV